MFDRPSIQLNLTYLLELLTIMVANFQNSIDIAHYDIKVTHKLVPDLSKPETLH